MQLTREVFDTLIWLTIILGSALAVVRLYRDFTRPLPPTSGSDVSTPVSASSAATAKTQSTRKRR